MILEIVGAIAVLAAIFRTSDSGEARYCYGILGAILLLTGAIG
jgi:hypothetical protein